MLIQQSPRWRLEQRLDSSLEGSVSLLSIPESRIRLT